MFEQFEVAGTAPQGVRSRALRGGTGSPLPLQRGHPQAMVMRHRVAGTAHHAACSKRTKALDCGQYIAEEAPGALLVEATSFFEGEHR